MAMNRADPDFLYPREMPDRSEVKEISLANIFKEESGVYEATVQRLTDDETFNILFD
jgi:hypothetical protein